MRSQPSLRRCGDRERPSIVIGLDGSQASRTALAWAVEAAVLRDRPLSVIGAFDPVPSASAATMTLPGDVLDALRDQMTEVVDDGVAFARSLTSTRGPTSTHRCARGSPRSPSAIG